MNLVNSPSYGLHITNIRQYHQSRESYLLSKKQQLATRNTKLKSPAGLYSLQPTCHLGSDLASCSYKYTSPAETWDEFIQLFLPPLLSLHNMPLKDMLATKKFITWSNPSTEIVLCPVRELDRLENTVVRYLCGNYSTCFHGKVTLGKCLIIFKMVFRVI